MAAPQVHNAEGKCCGRCKMKFEKHHFNITVTKPYEGSHLQEKVKVCKTCAHKYFSEKE